MHKHFNSFLLLKISVAFTFAVVAAFETTDNDNDNKTNIDPPNNYEPFLTPEEFLNAEKILRKNELFIFLNEIVIKLSTKIKINNQQSSFTFPNT